MVASIFANLSNHPSAAWSDGQRAAAFELATSIVDVPFPAVDPSLSEDEVLRLAAATATRVPAGTTHAMVMGELCLTFEIVRALQRAHVTCVAACGPRFAELIGEVKVSRFEFVRFRQYAALSDRGS